jgi:hypothetical protein
MYRAYWCDASEMRRLAITRGWLGTAARKAHTIPANLFWGLLWLVSAAVMAAASRELSGMPR